jgi:hypothetical protein
MRVRAQPCRFACVAGRRALSRFSLSCTLVRPHRDAEVAQWVTHHVVPPLRDSIPETTSNLVWSIRAMSSSAHSSPDGISQRDSGVTRPASGR